MAQKKRKKDEPGQPEPTADAQENQRVETVAGTLGEPQQIETPERVMRAAMPPELTRAQLDSRQAAIGQTRREAGPPLAPPAATRGAVAAEASSVDESIVEEPPES